MILSNSPIPTICQSAEIKSPSTQKCEYCQHPATSVVMANPVAQVCDKHGLLAACLGFRVIRRKEQ
jgi:hypothetical protein